MLLDLRGMRAPQSRRLPRWVIATAASLVLLQSQARAQSCAPLVPVQNSAFAGGVSQQPLNIAPYWSATVGASQGGVGILGFGWYYSGIPGLALHFNDYAPNTVAGRAVTVSGYNSFQQTVQGGVTGGSIIQFDVSWFNATTNGTSQPLRGNRSQLDVVYAGVTYATLYTTPTLALTGTKAAPASFSGATISTAPSWTTLPDEVAAAGSISRVQVTLPAGVPPLGVLMFRTRRNNPLSPDASSLTDDFSIRDPQILSPALCLVKRSTGSSGAFGFAVTGADTNLSTAGVQGTATVTTVAANTPVALDAWADNAGSGFGASLGATPMLAVNAGQPVIITEAVPAEFTLADVSCSSGGTATLAGNTATITGVVAAVTPTVCTFTNAALADLQVTKTNTAGINGGNDQADDVVTSGSTITYTVVVRNAGPASINAPVVRDTPETGISCAGGNPVNITGSGVPAGSYTVADLTGAQGITLGSLGNGQSATLTFQCTVN